MSFSVFFCPLNRARIPCALLLGVCAAVTILPWGTSWSAPPARILGPTVDVAILRCTPNPFSPRTVIHFEVFGDPEALYRVHVAIHDLTGNRVTTLFEGDLNPGPHEETWASTDQEDRAVAAGVYFAAVHLGERAAAQMVVLSK